MLQGLATYELIKTGLILYVSVCFLGCSIYVLIKSISKHYQKTGGNIITNNDNTQTLIYTVNNKNYVKIIPFRMVGKNNVLQPAYSPGNCTVYYAEKNPDDYQVNTNPIFMSGIFSGILCVVSCVILGIFMFFRKNKEAAGVIGGIDAAKSLISFAKN